MKIVKVHYKKLASLGNYENESVGAWADVEDGENPGETLAALKDWVECQLGEEKERRKTLQELDERIWRAAEQLAELDVRLAEARKQWEAIQTFMGAVGLSLPDAIQDDIPF